MAIIVYRWSNKSVDFCLKSIKRFNIFLKSNGFWIPAPGGFFYRENFSDCYKKQNEIALDIQDLFNKDVKKLVYHQAKLANKAKLDAIVCSPQEVSIVKKVFKKEIITPGIRLNLKSHDQKRVLSRHLLFVQILLESDLSCLSCQINSLLVD